MILLKLTLITVFECFVQAQILESTGYGVGVDAPWQLEHEQNDKLNEVTSGEETQVKYPDISDNEKDPELQFQNGYQYKHGLMPLIKELIKTPPLLNIKIELTQRPKGNDTAFANKYLFNSSLTSNKIASTLSSNMPAIEVTSTVLREGKGLHLKENELDKEMLPVKNSDQKPGAVLDALFNDKKDVDFYQSSDDLGKYKDLDDFKPIKPDISNSYNPAANSDFDLDAMLGKLSKLFSTTFSTQTAAESTRATVLDSNTDQVQLSTNTLVFGPLSEQSTEIPIIGPLNIPNHQKTNQVNNLEQTFTEKERYKLITMNKFNVTLHSILGQIGPEHSTETSGEPGKVELNSTEARSSKRQNRRKSQRLTSTTKQDEDLDNLDDKIEPSEQGETNSNQTYSYSGLFYNEKTTKVQPSKSTKRKFVFPTLRGTRKPKFPSWLKNILAKLPTTPSSIGPYRSTRTLFPFLIRTTTEKVKDQLKDDMRPGANSAAKSENENSNQGYIVGHNSGQGVSGFGNSNGQGGIVIGHNSGIGKRPSKRPYIAKPLVEIVTTSILVASTDAIQASE